MSTILLPLHLSHVLCSTGLSAGTCAVYFVHYSTSNHWVNHHLFADDTQLQKSTPPNDLQSCTDDIKAWMCNSQLKLNEDKTEAILFSTPSLSPCHCLPSSIMVGTHEIVFLDKVRNSGFILDSNLTMKQHVIKICSNSLLWIKTDASAPSVGTSQKMQQNNW